MIIKLQNRNVLKLANARKWKHQNGGSIADAKRSIGETPWVRHETFDEFDSLGQKIYNRDDATYFAEMEQNGGALTAGKLAKEHLTFRKNPDWDNLDRGYRYLTRDMGLDHDSAIALMGNVVEESQGYYNMAQKNGGRGLIQWDGRPTPKDRYAQWAHILRSVTTPANRRNPKTGQTENYWKSIGNQTGEQLRQKFNNPKTPIKTKTRIYSKSYLRPGKPRIPDRELSAAQLDSIYNPRIKNTTIRVKKKGGSMRIPGVIDSNPNLDNMKGNYVSKKKPLKIKKYGK